MKNQNLNIKKANILAIIPARGGSKEIPKKNIKKLAGIPLIEYTCKAAIKSKLIDKVIISTDNKEIMDIVVKIHKKIKAPFIRPAKISSDSASAYDIVSHALNWLEKNEAYIPDAVIYLQPTSPFRTSRQIDEAITSFQKNKKADTLVSIIPIPHNFHPGKIMTLSTSGFLKGRVKKNLNRQNMPVLFARNGPSILISSVDVIKKRKKLYGSYILPYLMNGIKSSVDIDCINDWTLAELLVKIK